MPVLHPFLIRSLPVALLALHAVARPLAQPPARRGTPAQIKEARGAFVEGVARVSRNEAAFEQTVDAGSGCELTISARRAERTDSVLTRHRFDAGHLATRMRMTIAPSGGVILFSYATVDGSPRVQRATRGAGNASERSEGTPELIVLVAETSNQPDVQLLTRSWTELVRVCGGAVES